MLTHRNPEAERREFLRMRVECPVYCRPLDGHREFHGRCRNLSGRGIQFETRHPLEPGARLRIRVAPEQSRITPLETRIEVLRIQPAGDGSFVVAACMLTGGG